MAIEKGDRNFNIFVTSQNSKSLPKRDLRATQIEIRNKIPHFDKIANIRYTRSGSIIINTTDAACAIETCNVSNFLGVAVSTHIIWKNITNRFLVFDIPIGVSLADLANEMSDNNEILFSNYVDFLKNTVKLNSLLSLLPPCHKN